jgi:hypothetical protein
MKFHQRLVGHLPRRSPAWVAIRLFAGVFVAACALAASPADPTPAPESADPWARVRGLEGEWVGTAEGEPGVGTVHRSYQFILGHRFLHERNVSAYAPKQPGTPGELHEHWSLISFDKRRKQLVLRQFHQEGFVNQYVLDGEQSRPGHLVFVSEALENLDSRWRARETYDVTADDRFVETFELAEPGKELQVYAKSSFTRVR